MRIYEIIEGRLPLIVHTGDYRYDYSHPRRLKKVLHAFPNLVVDAAHFGGWSVFDLAVEYLEDENCFLDMSSSRAFLGARRTQELVRIYGTDRILFGSVAEKVVKNSALPVLTIRPVTDEATGAPAQV